MNKNRLWLGLIVLSLGCNGGDDAETDSDTDTDTDTAPEFHPLVPEEYRYLWDTDGCETDDGPGAKVYRYMALGTSDGTNFTAEERWFWFHPEDGWDADCVDTFSLTGTYAAFDYDNLGCSGCEEAYEYTRTLTDSTCGILYHQLFDLEDPPDDQIYYGIVLFDSFTPNGNPNEDNKMLVIGANRVASNSYSVDPNYARGQVFGESEEYYPPQAATYNWLGDLCVNIE